MTKRRLWPPVGAALVVAGCIAGLAALPWAPTPGAHALVAAAVAAAEARIAAMSRDREVAWGERHDGSAFACYVAATAALPQQAAAWWDAAQRQVKDGHGVVPAARLQELRASWRVVLQHMVAGAHCRDATPHSQRDIRPMAIWWLADCEVGLRLREGDASAAVQLWLDSGTFRLDCGQGPWLLLAEWPDDELQLLPADVRAELATGLQRLEARLQQPPDPGAAFAAHARPLLDGHYRLFDWNWREVATAWQYGFDPTPRHLASFEQLYAHVGLLEPVAATGAGREAQWRALRAATAETNRFLVSIAIDHAAGLEIGQRRTLTMLRQLRQALAFHQRAAIPALRDPFSGDALEVVVDGDVAVFRAAEGKKSFERRAVRR